MKRNYFSLTIFTIFTYVLVNSVAVGQVEYTVKDIGTLGGDCTGYSINENGQITGSSKTATGETHAFIYSNGMITDLGSGGGLSIGYSINNSGEITGYHNGHAFLYSNGIMTDLPTPGNQNSCGYGINDRGQITGGFAAKNVNDMYNWNTFLYSDGVFRNVWTGENHSDTSISGNCGMAINNNGWITGWYTYGMGRDEAIILDPDGHITYGGLSSYGTSINDNGQITGYTYYYPEHGPAVIRAISTNFMSLDGGGDTMGYSINNSGQVTGSSGWYEELVSYRPHAFLFTEGIMVDLNSLIAPHLGSVLIEGRGIADNGLIVANGIGPDGYSHAFLLTPIPEPATLLLLGMGSLCLHRRHIY